MLSSEGYKMFRGTATITPKGGPLKPFKVTGDWLYKPDANCWYVNGESFPVEIVGNVQEDRTA